MSIEICLNTDIISQPTLILNGDDPCKDELELFLRYGVTGVNGYTAYFISEFVFDSDGHPRWDFTFKDEREYNNKDFPHLVSLNLAWDSWRSARKYSKQEPVC